MADIVSAAFILIGAVFCLIASLGLVRLPDIFMRLHATTKAGTLGVGLVMISVALNFESIGTSVRAIGVIFFVLLTAPVAAHMIARAAYQCGAKISDRTVINERETIR